jgi:hypothetical protein
LLSDAELEVPPASLCARCGSPLCEGCAGPGVSLSVSPIAWESGGPLVERFWATARASAVRPELVFGKLRDGPVLPACCFAIAVELIALGSVAGAAVGVCWLLLPDFAEAMAGAVLSNRPLTWVVLGLVPALAVLMVLLHAAWGVALEVGARLAGASWRPARGLRFAFYSCGWDLLTSPAGLVFGFFSGGALQAWQETLRAARVPRAAMDAYLCQSRALPPERSVRARRIVLALMAAPVLIGVLVLAWVAAAALWRLLQV